MKFGLSIEEARRVNVEGTRTFVETAKRSQRLRRVIYVGGFKIGAQNARETIARAGGYERSKIEADDLVRAYEREGVPITRVQPGTIIGDSRTGESKQLWGFADLVRDLFHGKIPALVGDASYWMPLMTVDFLARFIAGVPELEGEVEGEHIVIDDATPPMIELVERITRHLGVPVVRRTVPKGALEWFLRIGGERLTGVSPEAVSFIGPERYDVHATKRAMSAMGLEMPDIDLAVRRTVDHFLASRFGKRDVARTHALASGLRRVGGIPTWVEGSPNTVRRRPPPWNPARLGIVGRRRRGAARLLADAHAVRATLGEKLRALEVPVVIVAGERDPLVEDPGGVEVVTVAGSGHFPQLDAPAEVASVIARVVGRARLSVVRAA